MLGAEEALLGVDVDSHDVSMVENAGEDRCRLEEVLVDVSCYPGAISLGGWRVECFKHAK